MALLIPNAGETTGGNKYEALDQAEPDALDFEILGTDGSGVLTGCAVTTNNSSTNVAVSAGVIVLNGVPYPVSAASALGLPSAPADNRFDLVVARVTAGVAALVVVQGDNSSINPSFPRSASVITGTFSPTNNVNLATDVVLGALYRTGASAVTTSRIVDKRRMLTSSIVDQGAATPNNGYGNGSGALFYKTGAPNGTASGVWVKTSPGPWIELAQNVGAHTPIGAAMLWPSTAAVPLGCVEANGQLLSTTAYSALFAVYGYTHGGSGATFAVPNYHAKIIRGTTTTSNVGLQQGSDTIVLTTAQLPPHSHPFNHTHGYPHDHGINHTHPAGVTSSAGSHRHDVLPPPGVGNFGLAQSFPPGSGSVAFWAPSALYAPVGSRSGNQLMTDIEPSHAHGTPQLDYAGSTTSQSASTTSGPQPFTITDAIGSGSPVTVLPAVVHSRWIIRASLGTDPSFTGGGSLNTTQTVTSQTGSFTIALSDASALIVVGGAGNMSVHVPPASVVAFPVGTQIDFSLAGNTVTFVADGAAVIRSEGGLLNIATQYTVATLKKLPATNEWLLFGKLS